MRWLVVSALAVCAACEPYTVCEVRETRTATGFLLAADTTDNTWSLFEPGYSNVSGEPIGTTPPAYLNVYRVLPVGCGRNR